MDITDLKAQMKKAVSHLEWEFKTLQLWRASTWLVENIDVFIPSWWMNQKVNQVANIGIVDAQTLKIEPWDKSTLSSIEKAIFDSGLGLTPVNQWDYIIISVPALTKERRQELTKFVKKLGEDNKIALRNIRHDALNEVKKLHNDKEISEDEKANYESEINDLMKEYNTIVDDAVKSKSEEIMTV